MFALFKCRRLAGAERDEQLTRTTTGTRSAVSWDALLAIYLRALVLALGTGITLPAVPALAKSFGVSFGAASGVVTAFLVGNLIGTCPRVG